MNLILIGHGRLLLFFGFFTLLAFSGWTYAKDKTVVQATDTLRLSTTEYSGGIITEATSTFPLAIADSVFVSASDNNLVSYSNLSSTEAEYLEDRFTGLLSHIHWLISRANINRTSSRTTTPGQIDVTFFDKQIERTSDSIGDNISETRETLNTNLADLGARLSQAETNLADILSGSTSLPVASNITLGTNWLSGDGDDEGIYVDANGNVGVGTSTPTNKLTVAGQGYTDLRLYNESNSPNNGGMFIGSGADDVGLMMVGGEYDSSGFVARSTNPADLIFINGYIQLRSVGGTTPGAAYVPLARLSIRPDGTVSVGGADLDLAQLNVQPLVGTTIGLIVKGASGQTADLQQWKNFSGGVLGTMTATGNFGIGTTTPSAKLAITGTAGSGNIFVVASSTNASILTVTANGNVGIGTTTANSITALNIDLGASKTEAIHVSGINDKFIFLERNNSDGRGLVIGQQNQGHVYGTNASVIRSSGGVDQNISISPGLNMSSVRGNLELAPYGGNVGIGTTTPSARLSVVGQVAGDYFAAASSTATSTFAFDILASNPASGPIIRSQRNSSVYSQIYTDPSGGLLDLGRASNINFSGVRGFSGGAATPDWYVGQFSGDPFGSVNIGTGGATRVTVLSGGNVGVGTTTPGSTLTVAGNASLTGNISLLTSGSGISGPLPFINDTAGIEVGIMLGGVSHFKVRNNAVISRQSISVSDLSSTPSNGFYGFHSNNTLTGTGTGLYGGIAIQPVLSSFTNNGTYTGLNVNLPVMAGSGSVYAALFNGGNVGIGTTTPSDKLHVAGTGNTSISVDASFGTVASINLLTASAQRGRLFYSSAANTIVLQNGLGPDSTGLQIASNNYVGIGTTTPTSKLEVVGTSNNFETPVIKATSLNGAVSTSLTFSGLAANGNIFFHPGGSTTASVIMWGSGNVGIGTTSPATERLTVAGTIKSTALLGGSTNLTTDASGNIIRDPSDRRLKENITTIDNALDTLLGLRGVRYEWLDKERFGEQIEIGFIAQEVDELVPEVVQKGGEYWSLNTKNLVAVVVEAIKEMWVTVSGHEERLDEYQGLIEELKTENTTLKTRLENIERELNIEEEVEEPASEGNETPVEDPDTQAEPPGDTPEEEPSTPEPEPEPQPAE